jgi:uncharacterized protein (DUF433 family)
MAASTELISVDPEVMSGTPVFAGTRVPVQTLVDHLAAGDPLEEFLDGFPSVSREQAVRFLEEASQEYVERHGFSAA